MRFMAMHRSTPRDEAGLPPSAELMQGMGELIQEGVASGVFLAGEGLRSSAHRVRARFADGKASIYRGPYAGDHELIASFMLIRAASIDEALEWATRLAGILGDVEIEVGTVCEPWDLGFVPRPDGLVPIRFLLLCKSTPDTEAGLPLSPTAQEAIERLKSEMTGAGVLLSAEELQPSSKAVRLRFVGGRRTLLMDGPFTESKELVAGFSMFRFDTMNEMVEWTGRFARLFPEVEVDIRPVQEAPEAEKA